MRNGNRTIGDASARPNADFLLLRVYYGADLMPPISQCGLVQSSHWAEIHERAERKYEPPCKRRLANLKPV